MIKKLNSGHGEYFEISDGEIRFWLEQYSSIHIKTENQHGDPVELSIREAVELAEQILLLAKKSQDNSIDIASEKKLEPKANIITLGVNDLTKSKDFYMKLGWTPSKASQDNIIFFQLTNIVLALYSKRLLAEDAMANSIGNGFKGFTLAQNVRTKEEVAKALEIAEKAGGKIQKPAQDVFWGGHSGYFTDPDGFLWEVAWNPFFKLNEKGILELP